MPEMSNNALHIKAHPMFKVIDKVKYLEAHGKNVNHLEIDATDLGGISHARP
jgi:hypothetical protein